jgi:uncharacterized protein (DUF488 family)
VATLYTVGHGARSADELISILKQSEVQTLVDVRAFPSSKRHPQFSRQPLSIALESAGIAYQWQGEALGGFRKGSANSPHAALRHPMFRAYAEHMATASFAEAATGLARRRGRVCIMCAESNPAECHRSLIADWLVAHGHAVVHVLGEGRMREHALNPAARMEEGRLVYAGAQQRLL